MRKIVATFFFLVFVASFFAAVEWSATFPNCIAKESAHSAAEQQKERLSTFGIYVRCVGDFTHENHGPITALFTVILGVATICLWWATRDLVEEAGSSSKRQLRAYISIDPKDALNWVQRKNKVGVGFVLKNHGKIPGSETFYNFDMAVLDSPLPDGYVFAGPTRTYDQNTTVFPEHTLPVRMLFDRDLTNEERAAIEKGTKRFHTWGTLSYRDGFEDSPTRTTKLSFSFGGPDFAKSFIDKSVKWSWEWGPTHNDAT